MQVSAKYAREHLEELIVFAQHGEEVEIACEGKPLAKLIIMQPSAHAEQPSRKAIVLGAGRGELVLPTDEEWRQMKEEDARLMNNAPPITTGEIVLGAGRGELELPTDDEWRALDDDYTRMMTEAPLTTTGEI